MDFKKRLLKERGIRDMTKIISKIENKILKINKKGGRKIKIRCTTRELCKLPFFYGFSLFEEEIEIIKKHFEREFLLSCEVYYYNEYHKYIFIKW